MNRRSPEDEGSGREMRRSGYMSSQRWHRAGEEHAWRRPGRSNFLGGHRGRGAGGWRPSGQPSLSSNRSFWRPVNGNNEDQQKAASQPDAQDQAPPEQFEVAPSTPAQLDLRQQQLQHQVPQHPLPSQQQQTRKDDDPKPSEQTRSPVQHEQAVAPSSIQMPMGLPGNSTPRVPQQLDDPGVQRNQLPQQAMLHQGQETEETKLDKGMSSSPQMALPDSTPQSEPVGSYSRMPFARRRGYHAYSRRLHRANKRYVVAKLEQAKQRKLNAILNKLTPQNFCKLLNKVQEVDIDTMETLSWFVSQIFRQVLMEPTFCQIYAKFCSELNWSLPAFRGDDKIITFKRLLLNRCQGQFERDEREEAEAGKTEEETEIEQTQEETEEMIASAKRRNLGNIIFIGELCKARLLPEKIIHHCIKELLGSLENPDEVKIEALCKLIATTGEMIDIDRPKIKEAMDAYFDTMQKLSTDQKLSWRVRFLLRDLIDLRKNKWQQKCGSIAFSADIYDD